MSQHSPGSNESLGAAFPYELLLAYYRGEVFDPVESARIEGSLRTDPRWQAHWKSIEFLDLERAAAIQDAADLEGFNDQQSSSDQRFCMSVAKTNGEVLRPLVKGEQPSNGLSREDWTGHIRSCVFCRRMRRQMHARVVQEGLPEGELLLRDWLLEDYYVSALEAARQRIIPPPPDIKRVASVVPTLILHFGGGRFIAIQANGTRANLEPRPTGRLQAWDYRTIRPSSLPSGVPQGAAVLPGPKSGEVRMAVEFQRELDPGRGTLSISFQVKENDEVTCGVILQRSEKEPEPLPEVVLSVEVRGQPVIRVVGSERKLRGSSSVSSLSGLAGSWIRVHVVQGTQVWEDSRFQFQG